MRGPIKAVDDVQRAIVDPEEWHRARAPLLAREKEHTRAGDRLAAERRRLPWMAVEKNYEFETITAGRANLVDLFEDRHQLIVYHHMLKPADPDPCSGCGMVGDQMPHLAHLHQRDTTLVFVSRAPADEIDAFSKRMGWTVPWYSTLDDFGADFDVLDGFGFNVFYRSGGDIYRTYFTTGRAAEALGTTWTLLDLTPLGRQETWEDSPKGTPQTPPYEWWRLHDEYRS
jgi:predicted dithiol-disulfide oxidoreductase (DUF899 family)